MTDNNEIADSFASIGYVGSEPFWSIISSTILEEINEELGSRRTANCDVLELQTKITLGG